MAENLDQLVQDQLNLQVKISYGDHHGFMLRHGLAKCARVLDIGTGNGTFAARLADDHSSIQFVGIDKRKYCIDSCQNLVAKNLNFAQVDMFSRTSSFDFSQFDGFLMRYFLLHVDYSRKILELLKDKSKRPSRFWIIDLDFSQFSCVPTNKVFDKLTRLVKDFCSKKSMDSMAGQRIVPLLQELDYKNIIVENIPFSSKTIPLNELALYIKQEVFCYSTMSGRPSDDPETLEIVDFIDKEFQSGKYQISYGMILVFAELS